MALLVDPSAKDSLTSDDVRAAMGLWELGVYAADLLFVGLTDIKTDMPEALYDQIGTTYTSTRHPDPRIAAAIKGALGRARAVVNVGAGAGAYEPTDRSIVAVEPSSSMIRKGRVEQLR